MSIQLSVTLKDGKTPVTATVTDSTVEGAKALLEQVRGMFTATPTTSKASVKTTEEAPAEQIEQTTSTAPADVKAPGKREQKKNAEMKAREMNEQALLWARRAIVCIPDFNEMNEVQLAAKLNFRKPLALMTAEESADFVGLLKDTLKLYAANHSDVQAFLDLVQVIETLDSPNDWELKKEKLPRGTWSAMQVNGAHLFHAAKAELDARQNLLQVAAIV